MFSVLFADDSVLGSSEVFDNKTESHRDVALIRWKRIRSTQKLTIIQKCIRVEILLFLSGLYTGTTHPQLLSFYYSCIKHVF